jgi:hypothetical protein
MATMRTAIETVERLCDCPTELRPFFVHSEASIALAVEITHAGGRMPLPANADDAWTDLLSSGLVHFGLGALRGWVEIDSMLLATFLGAT